jgi:hypothetical protein
LLVVPSLRDGGIGLMTSGGRHTLIFVIDLSRCLQKFL